MSDNQLPPPVQGSGQDESSQPVEDYAVRSDASTLPTIPAPMASQPPHSATPSGVVGAPSLSTPDASSASANTLIAEDVDLIEKEWVSKAKNIVEQTRSNPNQQSKELGKFKATYIKARYGKDMRVSE